MPSPAHAVSSEPLTCASCDRSAQSTTVPDSTDLNRWLAENTFQLTHEMDDRTQMDIQAVNHRVMTNKYMKKRMVQPNVVEINWICRAGLPLALKLAGLDGAMTTITHADMAQCARKCVGSKSGLEL